MPVSEVRTARDYNRGLAAPIRWGHQAWAAAVAGPRALARWTVARRGGTWWRLGLVGAASIAATLPLDRAIAYGARWVDGWVYGDADRVLHWLQEYGQGPSIVLVALLIWRLDPKRRGQMVYWLAGLAIAWLVLMTLKLSVGRPRPKFDDPWVFLGPFGRYPLGAGRGVHHAWEFWVPYTWDLWSMPSSHTAYAAVMSYFLGSLYPRIRPLVIVLAVLVGACRVLYGAHYTSDVVAGGLVGVIAGRVAMRRSAWRDGSSSPGAGGATGGASAPNTLRSGLSHDNAVHRKA